MIITVQYHANEFVAFDENNQRVTDRNLLQQIAFEPFPAYKGVVTVEVPTQPTQEEIPLNIKINLDKP